MSRLLRSNTSSTVKWVQHSNCARSVRKTVKISGLSPVVTFSVLRVLLLGRTRKGAEAVVRFVE